MRSPFDDPDLYDWEYRRRRDDVRFYRTLAAERGGPILDLGCGTGRLLIPLVRDGHVVVGVDRAPAMLARAAARAKRLGPAARKRVLLARGDLRALSFAPRFAFAICAFHTVQHCESDADLRDFFEGAAQALIPGGWLAFDTFAPSPRFLERTGPSGLTKFHHPRTGRATSYQESHRVVTSSGRRLLAMTFSYRSAGATGRLRARNVSLRHRLLEPAEIGGLLTRAGLELIASWGGFDGSALQNRRQPTEQHVYLTRRNMGRGRRK